MHHQLESSDNKQLLNVLFLLIEDPKSTLKFYDDTIYSDDNEKVIDTSAANTPILIYDPRVDTTRDYRGPYDLNLIRVRGSLIRSFGNFAQRVNRTDSQRYDQYYYLMEKLKFKLGIKRLITTRFERRLWKEIKDESYDVFYKINRSFQFVNSKFQSYKNNRDRKSL